MASTAGLLLAAHRRGESRLVSPGGGQKHLLQRLLHLHLSQSVPPAWLGEVHQPLVGGCQAHTKGLLSLEAVEEGHFTLESEAEEAQPGKSSHLGWPHPWPFILLPPKLQEREAGPRQRPAAACALPEDVRRLREELRPGHGAGEDLDWAFSHLQEHHPWHPGVRLTEAPASLMLLVESGPSMHFSPDVLTFDVSWQPFT